MLRPVSIVNFERCYLAAIVVGLINSVISVPLMLHSPQLAQATARTGTGIIYVGMAIGVLIPLLLWFFTARRASVVCKWIIVAFFALGVLGVLRNLATGFPSGLAGVLAITALILQAVAVFLLFRPDARAWFMDGRGEDLDDTFA